MTHPRDINRLLDHWLAEGSTVAPDRIADVVADRIERQYQRPAWLAERNLAMTSTLRLAAAVAAIAILGAGAVYLFDRTPAPDVGQPSAAPSASSVPSAPSASATITSSVAFKPALRIALPPGWIIEDDTQLFRMTTTRAADGPAGVVEFRASPVVGSNANDCEGLVDVAVGTSVTDIVAALSNAPQFAAVAAAPITLDGSSAEVLDLALDPGWTATCSWSEGQPASMLFTVADPPGPFVGLRGADRLRAILVEVGGTVVAILVSPDDPADFDAFLAEAMPLVEGVDFTP